MNNEIYLDNAATTPLLSEVIEDMRFLDKTCYGNPSSMHTMGIKSERIIKISRERIAQTMGIMPSEIVFTSGGTEANNLAISGFVGANLRTGRNIITSQIEHPSVLEVFKKLAKLGYHTSYIRVDQNGRIDLDQLKDEIDNDTSLISISLINNEVGVIQDIDEIVRIKNGKNSSAVIHVDAVQGYGKMHINPKKTGIDMLSISAHKIHGPKGVGALFCSHKVRLAPQVLGGGQENAIRSGTENVSGISGFGLAAKISCQEISQKQNTVLALKNEMLQALKGTSLDFIDLSACGTTPYILSIAFPDIKAEVLLHHLAQAGIFVSAGSACSSRKNIRSHVLSAMNVTNQYIDGSIRISFSGFNTRSEVETTVRELSRIIPQISNRRKGAK